MMRRLICILEVTAIVCSGLPGQEAGKVLFVLFYSLLSLTSQS